MPGAAERSAKSSNKTTDIFPVSGFPGENELRDLQFKLSHNLQSTLDLRATLENFLNNIADTVSVSGISYFGNAATRKIEIGKLAPHTADYNIRSDTANLGKIVFHRSKRFLEGELAVLEVLIGILFYPLRNALMYQEALENSMRDPLTGIGNRQALENSFEREVKLAQRHKRNLSVLMMDIDHFKLVNDQHGHGDGDKVLTHVASLIKESLRETDQLFRYGGEEFIVLLHNADNCSANLTAERIRRHLSVNTIKLERGELAVTISIGLTSLTNANDSSSTLFNLADQALYQAKNEGRNRVVSLLPKEMESSPG